MTSDPETRQFIATHRHEEVHKLALQAGRYKNIDLPFALAQIAGWQKASTKIPAWAQTEGQLYPPHLSLEQCSSQATAQYKARLLAGYPLENRDHLTDLTGGFGVDCAFLSPLFRHTDYVERQEELCRAAAHNFPLLGQGHIRIHCCDAVDYLKQMAPCDVVFIDPARRDCHGGKTVAISQCEPDVSALESQLLDKARVVLIKLSPMLDLTLSLMQMRHVGQAHLVAVQNECKELLLLLSREADTSPEQVPIHCINLSADGDAPANAPFVFTRRDEQQSPCTYATEVNRYLYEPHAALLKAGAFRSLSAHYKVDKLHPNSHLYTSATLVQGFPGRCFRVENVCRPEAKELRRIIGPEAKANLSVRNFPMTVADLRRKLKLTEGGDFYLFATTLADHRKALLVTRKAL